MSLRYLDEFTRCECAPDLLALRLFPNAKEIQESFAAYNAVRTHLRHLPFSDSDVLMVAVGDGHVPRTAATFAFRSRWTCMSVDPAMRERWTVRRDVQRLTALRMRIEDVELPRGYSAVVLVSVHGHAPLHVAVAMALRACTRVAVVSIPCCFDDGLPTPPDVSYEDEGITSPHRRVNVWRSMLEDA